MIITSSFPLLAIHETVAFLQYLGDRIPGLVTPASAVRLSDATCFGYFERPSLISRFIHAYCESRRRVTHRPRPAHRAPPQTASRDAALSLNATLNYYCGRQDVNEVLEIYINLFVCPRHREEWQWSRNTVSGTRRGDSAAPSPRAAPLWPKNHRLRLLHLFMASLR